MRNTKATTITLPLYLKKRMEEVGEGMSWSKIAADRFEQVCHEKECKQLAALQKKKRFQCPSCDGAKLVLNVTSSGDLIDCAGDPMVVNLNGWSLSSESSVLCSTCGYDAPLWRFDTRQTIFTCVLVAPDEAVYVSSALAESASIAIALVQDQAQASGNFDSEYKPEDFDCIAVFKGDQLPNLIRRRER